MATPTGCFKCGRPGHWSRDCPSSGAEKIRSDATPSPRSNSNHNSSSTTWKKSFPSSSSALNSSSKGKPPVIPRKRPKLTPDLLLSNDGIGYVLENFPRMVKIRGSGHELEDLKGLLDAYVHWHSRILPYFSFDQFVGMVEKVGSTKRVRSCIRELKERYTRGEQLKMTETEKGPENDTQEQTVHDPEMNVQDNGLPGDVNEDLFDEFYRQAMPASEGSTIREDKESSFQAHRCGENGATRADNVVILHENVGQTPKSINEEQKSRMEANRLKALERAKARATAAAAALES